MELWVDSSTIVLQAIISGFPQAFCFFFEAPLTLPHTTMTATRRPLLEEHDLPKTSSQVAGWWDGNGEQTVCTFSGPIH